MEDEYLSEHARDEILEELREIRHLLATLTRLNMRVAELLLDLQARIQLQAHEETRMEDNTVKDVLPDFVTGNPWISVIRGRGDVR